VGTLLDRKQLRSANRFVKLIELLSALGAVSAIGWGEGAEFQLAAREAKGTRKNKNVIYPLLTSKQNVWKSSSNLFWICHVWRRIGTNFSSNPLISMN
jgi:hypothetical protein